MEEEEERDVGMLKSKTGSDFLEYMSKFSEESL